VEKMKSYSEQSDCAFQLAKAMTHEKAVSFIVASGLAKNDLEAEKLIFEGRMRDARGIKPEWPDPLRAPLKRLPRYDPIMQEAEDDLAKRHGRRAAQEMIDEEDSRISGKGR